MPEDEFTVTAGENHVSALYTRHAGPASAAFIYAPGAGSNLDDGFGKFLADQLTAQGLAMVRFQFPYMEAGRRRPDSPRVLEETWRAVIETVRREASRTIVGGRSMGGRYASRVVAHGAPADALALFAYPLHPPGNPERPRDGHFPDIRIPTLFCSGDRDSFATPEELRTATAEVPDATLHILEAADHGFAVPRSSGRTRDGVWADATQAFLDWLRAKGLFNAAPR